MSGPGGLPYSPSPRVCGEQIAVHADASLYRLHSKFFTPDCLSIFLFPGFNFAPRTVISIELQGVCLISMLILKIQVLFLINLWTFNGNPTILEQSFSKTWSLVPMHHYLQDHYHHYLKYSFLVPVAELLKRYGDMAWNPSVLPVLHVTR